MQALAADQGAAAARAIMTTDPFPKNRPRACASARATSTSAAWPGFGHDQAQHGDDARVRDHGCDGPGPLLRALREAVNDTFNAITVDGECSTNDCVMLLANGASGVTIDESSRRLAAGLRSVCLQLALDIVRGGEGATKLVTVTVTGGSDERRCGGPPRRLRILSS
jgi:glutamate N-acetyltransferase/amino-acid N-acetyltransferase